MSAESPHRIFDCLLSGSDPVEAVDDVLRSVNSSHGAFESPLVHTLRLCNVIADMARSHGVSRCDR
jgi:hypothetical protein